ncbi:hypothetical protein YC2023_062240 [Brassica napus]|uniref:Uncharacterized protein n=2 Tax=Brassica oleracea TaxID=3712 RepID=A0A0D3BK62_BRAOL|nr:unnamed protein product [Brassica oleracea]
MALSIATYIFSTSINTNNLQLRLNFSTPALNVQEQEDKNTSRYVHKEQSRIKYSKRGDIFG